MTRCGASCELDPLGDEAHERLLRLWIELGRYNLAIQRYRAFETTLKAELGSGPDPRVAELYREAVQRRRPRSCGTAHRRAGPEPNPSSLRLEPGSGHPG